MHKSLSLIVLVILSCVSCSKKADVDRRLEELVPSDAAAIVRFSSIEKVQQEFMSLPATVEAPLPCDPISLMIKGAGVDMTEVDPSKPMAVAFSFSKTTQSLAPTYIVPMKNAKAAAANFRLGEATACGHYAVFSSEPGYRAGNSTIAKGLCTGALFIRLDLKKIIAMYRDQILWIVGRGEEFLDRILAANEIPGGLKKYSFLQAVDCLEKLP